MTARSAPYPPEGFRVRLPGSVWSAALAEVRRYAELGTTGSGQGSEGLVYLAGVVGSDELVVTAVLRLQHAPQGDRVAPTRDEVRWLVSTLRKRDEKLIAQLHSHRHGGAHSPGDDRMATSFHDGFLSIVAPNFAVGVERIDQCVVHEYRHGAFRALERTEVAARFIVQPDVVDRLRHHAEEVTTWRRFVRKLKSIARR